jgi:hypothetical protein
MIRGRDSGLSGPATMAHFHGPAAAGKNGPPVIWLGPKGSPVQARVKEKPRCPPRAGAAILRRRVVHQRAHAGSSGRRDPRSGDAAQELIAAAEVDDSGCSARALQPKSRRTGRLLHVSYFAQIPDRQRRRLTMIETPTQSVRPLIQAEPETHASVRGLAPKRVGRKDIPCKYLKSFKENR